MAMRLSTFAKPVRAARLVMPRGMASRNFATKHEVVLPDLPYDYNALSPVIIPEIMEIHHKKHHQAYVNGFNTAMAQLDEAASKGDPDGVVALQSALKFNGGGHINHSIFWKALIPPKNFELPSGKLAKEINSTWGSLDNFISKFNAAATGVQGSGWGWLGYNPETGGLQIATTPNQDPLQASTKLVPVMGVDVWEHAYYLQYKNVRPDYLREVWKVINWAEAGKRYQEAASK